MSASRHPLQRRPDPHLRRQGRVIVQAQPVDDEASESALREWIVSSRVNRTGHGDDDPTIVEPMAEVG